MADPAVTDPAPSNPAPAVVAPVVADPAAVATPPVADPAAKAADPAATPNPNAPVVPEKYDFTSVKLPDGISLNSDLVEAVTPVLLKKGFTQAEANELIETHAAALKKAEDAAEVQRDADFKEWMKNQVTQHQTALRKEWGTGYDANMVVAQRGMTTVFGPAGKAILDETGLGNHPEFVKAFHKVGLMVAEDRLPNGGLPPNSGKSAANVLYPSMPTN